MPEKRLSEEFETVILDQIRACFDKLITEDPSLKRRLSDLVVDIDPAEGVDMGRSDWFSEISDRTFYKIRAGFALRNKTAEERGDEVHQRAEEIITKHTKQTYICITCKQPITDQHTLVPSIHGPYHGPPLTCVEGR